MNKISKTKGFLTLINSQHKFAQSCRFELKMQLISNNMKSIKSALIVFLFFMSFHPGHGQFNMESQEVMFSSRLDNPIKIEVMDKGSEVIFYSENRSNYPYQLEIDFKIIQNLSPSYQKYNFVVSPGRNNLFTLMVVDKNSNHYYEYRSSYAIGDPRQKINEHYPYLIPLGSSKTVNLFLYGQERKYVNDFFAMNQGDTVFCMRKGYVTAVPGMLHEGDRISKNKSLEVMHNDGTVMIYENIDPDHCPVKLGQTVYPNESLGIIGYKYVLCVGLYRFLENGRLGKVNIDYCIDETKTMLFSDSLTNVGIKHPTVIITKEMSRREKKRYLSNKRVP